MLRRKLKYTNAGSNITNNPMINSRHTLFAAAVLAAFCAVSCETAPDAASRTDAMRQEIFHGHPKTLRTATYPAHSNAGEWFKDTAATDVPQTTYTYNADGYLTEEVHDQGDTLPIVTIGYEYTPGCSRKVAAVWMSDSSEMSRVAYRYDKNDRLIGTETTNPEGSIVWKDDYDLNRNGYSKEVRYTRGNGVLFMREVNEYNRAGELTGQDIYTYGKDNNRHTVIRFTYQGNGLKASATLQDEQASPKEIRKTFTYEYDAQGNWIRRVAYNETLKTAEITERQIEYYE